MRGDRAENLDKGRGPTWWLSMKFLSRPFKRVRFESVVVSATGSQDLLVRGHFHEVAVNLHQNSMASATSRG